MSLHNSKSGVFVGSVLVIDDDEMIRQIMRDLLECAHFRVEEVQDGNAALGFLQNQQVDVIITDLLMFGMGGIEFLGNLRARKDFTPVICCSGAADRPTQLKALQLGACAFVEKPFRNNSLVQAVSEACVALARDSISSSGVAV